MRNETLRGLILQNNKKINCSLSVTIMTDEMEAAFILNFDVTF